MKILPKAKEAACLISSEVDSKEEVTTWSKFWLVVSTLLPISPKDNKANNLT